MLLPLMNLIGYMSAEKTAYYRMNAHGDVVAVVDGFGETLKTYKYDAFGKQEEDGNEWLKILFGVNVKDSNPFRYCAEYYDEETEFIYLRARYYSPEIQRFISEDPIKDGINWYAYCGNNPVMFCDPSGYISCGKYSNGGNDRVKKYPIEELFEFFSELFTKMADVFQKAKDAGIKLASKEFLELLKDTNFLYRSDNIFLAAEKRDSAIAKHYENNEKIQITGFIDDQNSGKAADIIMGNPIFGSNACGWVAAYNAFKKLKNKVSPADIISFFESNDYLIADGAFGVNPLAFDHLFEVYGFSSSTVYFDDKDLDEKAKAADTAILAYAYVSNKSVGAHFINLTWDEEKGEYIVYNDNGNFKSISDFLESNDYIFISLTSINKREVYYV